LVVNGGRVIGRFKVDTGALHGSLRALGTILKITMVSTQSPCPLGIGATIAQRIVRAKRTLREASVPFEIPPADERSHRLSSVLEVIYLVFNEGYAATSGENWMRIDLCREALRMGRVLLALMPDSADTTGLVALMELQSSRNGARVEKNGEPVLLPQQNRLLWDQLLIRRGLALLDRGSQMRGGTTSPYVLQAAIAACHARATAYGQTDWAAIATLYGQLAQAIPSPIVELNRAVAVSMAFGPETGLPMIDALSQEPALANFHLLPAVRGDILARLGRLDEARAELLQAAQLTQNVVEQRLLRKRATEL